MVGAAWCLARIVYRCLRVKIRETSHDRPAGKMWGKTTWSSKTKGDLVSSRKGRTPGESPDVDLGVAVLF